MDHTLLVTICIIGVAVLLIFLLIRMRPTKPENNRFPIEEWKAEAEEKKSRSSSKLSEGIRPHLRGKKMITGLWIVIIAYFGIFIVFPPLCVILVCELKNQRIQALEAGECARRSEERAREAERRALEVERRALEAERRELEAERRVKELEQQQECARALHEQQIGEIERKFNLACEQLRIELDEARSDCRRLYDRGHDAVGKAAYYEEFCSKMTPLIKEVESLQKQLDRAHSKEYEHRLSELLFSLIRVAGLGVAGA